MEAAEKKAQKALRPKRPNSSYIFYLQDNVKGMAEAHADKKYKEIIAMIG